MKYILTILCCLIFVSASAEIIGNVKYHLPIAAHDWVIGNKFECENGTTIVYIPSGVERQACEEFFGVNCNCFHSDLNVSLAENLSLTTLFPNMGIELHVFEERQSSLICEWSAQEDGQEEIHGWCRIFSNQDGTVVMAYQTENITDLALARSIWLPVLQEAQSQ